MTRDEYVRKAADGLAELRRPAVAAEIDIPDDVLAAGAGALEAILGRPCRWEAQTILAAALPLLRAQWEAEQEDRLSEAYGEGYSHGYESGADRG